MLRFRVWSGRVWTRWNRITQVLIRPWLVLSSNCSSDKWVYRKTYYFTPKARRKLSSSMLRYLILNSYCREVQVFNKVPSCHCESMLPNVCSVIDHGWRQNVVRTQKSGTRGDRCKRRHLYVCPLNEHECTDKSKCENNSPYLMKLSTFLIEQLQLMDLVSSNGTF